MGGLSMDCGAQGRSSKSRRSSLPGLPQDESRDECKSLSAWHYVPLLRFMHAARGVYWKLAATTTGELVSLQAR